MRRDQAQAAREAQVAATIQKTAVHRMDSDDFVTPKEVANQLLQLSSYVEMRRIAEPDYMLPRGVGYRLGVLLLTIPDKTDGGLHITEEHKEARAMASPQGVVLNMGDICFDKYGAPWCAIGDRIIFSKYAGKGFQIANGQRLAMLSDDMVGGIIDGNWEVPS